MTMHLTVEAEPAGKTSISATGRDAAQCGKLEGNLIVETYEAVLKAESVDVVPLALTVRNEIPLGKGCGSSAAALLAGVALANHFGGLGWSRDEVLREASVREGHPDNVAACWLGGLVLSAMETAENGGVDVRAVSIQPAKDWKLLVVTQAEPLATTAARGLLPESYSKADAVFNVQRVALLTAAFAGGCDGLLKTAMQDRIHQPYRAKVCPLLPALEGLAGRDGVLGVALSGAGPSVLMVLAEEADVEKVKRLVAERTGGIAGVETILCGVEAQPASVEVV
jgi:homoserine kinase